MPWRQRRSALAAAPVGAAGIWQVWASDGPQYLQRPLPGGSAWMQAGQGPGSLRGAGRERRRLALDTPAAGVDAPDLRPNCIRPAPRSGGC